ncbi:MAG TPA: ROK family protein [Solirubrobacter sp.]|nr:ROK family protein [Solirubrobacter sp.]
MIEGAGTVLRLIRDGHANTRGALAQRTGMSRSTLSERVHALLSLDLVREVDGAQSTGGRPPATLTFNDEAGVVLVADVGATRCRLAVCDLAPVALAEQELTMDPARAPETLLAELDARFGALLAECDEPPARVMGVGLALPGPVAAGRGARVRSELLPERPAFSVTGSPVLVDSRANAMALGEYWTHRRDADPLLFVEAWPGLACGIVSARGLHRGAHGVAGDIAHIRVAGRDDPCRCGNAGCLEAVAGGAALAARLSAAGLPARTGRDVVALAGAGEPLAIQAVREAGRALGEVLAECVNLLNPSAIVLGGELAGCAEQLLAGVRETTIRRSLPLAARHLDVGCSQLGPRAGLIGAAVLVVDHLMAPENIDHEVRRWSDRRSTYRRRSPKSWATNGNRSADQQV